MTLRVLLPMLRCSRSLITFSRTSSGLLELSSPCFEQHRSYNSTNQLRKELPYHLVVGLPALSPTMEAGTLAEWYVAEGDSFSAGDGIARIETDKAAMDFEAQDDGFVAKILMQAGQGNEITVGTPIMITVEDGESVGAFKDYVYKGDTAIPASPKMPPATTPAAATITSSTSTSSAQPVSTPTPTPTAIASVDKPIVPATVSGTPPKSAPKVFSTYLGLSVTKTSPLAKTLAAEQAKYKLLYGTTGQNPIL